MTPLTTEQLLALVPRCMDEDLSQELALTLLQARPETQAEALSLIARKQYQHQHRRRDARRWANQLPDEDLAAEQGSTRQVSPILAVIDRMPQPLRDVLMYRYVSGLTPEETAARLGVSRRTVFRLSDAAKHAVITSIGGTEAPVPLPT